MAKTTRSPRSKRTTTRTRTTRTRTRAPAHAKKKQVVKPASSRGMLRKDALGFALKAMLKKKGGRTDIEIQDAPKSHHSLMTEVPLQERAGYPLVRDKGSVDPATWRSNDGKEIIVDFSRHAWLPDNWGQGVKSTKPKSFKKTTGGGTYTVMVSPEGKVFYHRKAAEEFYGKPFSLELGFNGQVRTAKLQGQEAIQVARASIKDINAKGEIKTDADSMLFGLLKPSEKKFLLNKNKFHFCIISARRATQVSGIRDLFMVQSQFLEAGVEPVWYVDEQSLKDYKKLGLNAVVGGKLTPARNKALQDAQKMGKICVQASDDISAWEYRVGKKATEKNDDACNEAYDAAKRLILSPVAAAQFILAKMRGSEEPPKLGGVYMLGSCARTFGGDEFVTKHFILGDFFVVDADNKVRFDEEMTLKEDYDFTASHIKEYGSVLRCQRMTLRVKHYDNSGGACTNRDGKGKEEQKNIAILKRKWPRAIRDHHTRKNEVILSWPSNNDAEGLETPVPRSRPSRASNKVMKVAMKKKKKPTKSSKPRRAVRKGAKTVDRVELPCSPNAKMVVTGKVAKCPGINARLKKVNGKRVHEVVGKVQYTSPKGQQRTYNCSDLRYDQTFGYLTLKVCLQGIGKHWKRSIAASDSSSLTVENSYGLSQKTDRIDFFFSHDWETSRLLKWLSLLVMFNSHAAATAMMLVTTCLVVLAAMGGLPMVLWPWLPVFSMLSYAVMFLFWQRFRSFCGKPLLVFLDRLCIAQHDMALKEQGIRGLGSFLEKSQNLTILWSGRYFSRLWCLYEVASYLKDERSEHKNIQILPVHLCLLLCIASAQATSWMFAIHLAVGTMGVDGWRIIENPVLFNLFGRGGAAFIPVALYVGLGCMTRLYQLPRQLQNFRVQDAQCFCCSNGHQHPETGKELPCDRRLVFSALEKWFSRDDDVDGDWMERFNRMVREKLSSRIAHTVGRGLPPFKYVLSTVCLAPVPYIGFFIVVSFMGLEDEEIDGHDLDKEDDMVFFVLAELMEFLLPSLYGVFCLLLIIQVCRLVFYFFQKLGISTSVLAHPCRRALLALLISPMLWAVLVFGIWVPMIGEFSDGGELLPEVKGILYLLYCAVVGAFFFLPELDCSQPGVSTNGGTWRDPGTILGSGEIPSISGTALKPGVDSAMGEDLCREIEEELMSVRF